MSRKELLVLLDDRAQRFLGMSGDEFSHKLKIGAELPESGAATHLAVLAGAAAAR